MAGARLKQGAPFFGEGVVRVLVLDDDLADEAKGAFDGSGFQVLEGAVARLRW
jgi:hypothetical protein